ncbi:SDR family NAD(P)-dependent oxidoreductase [Prevotella melaninogenica]|uniref:SDR family oxidoreductase n=1 Tax=Prevotella melaninogenica TaxID=28132 RepID=A0A7D4FXK2_9BACT|nr:SDR family oxidoreductase [Prevotella melaninogenica]EFC72064.1 oxidoreductase, short chain dehydrogenase/reductase family protein [Prevotella melaninogenica D18]QKH88554.1 SDR family oxidoreductase [Prevotella melaninogenica]
MMTSLRKKIIAIGGALAYPTISLSPDITREHFYRKWVLVTGASHGIGRALTEKIINAGANVFLIARSEADLRFLCAKAKQMGSSADYCAIDLRDREKLEQLCQKLRETLPRLDYFFCNAGKSIHRKINDAQDRLHDYDRTMDLNYRSLVALSLAILPALKASKGRIIYSSSVSTLYPMAPGWSAYHASKSAANTWCETADSEFAPLGVHVQIAYLPLVHTAMSDVNEQYKHLPAYTPANAANILLKLAIRKVRTYKPWWAKFSAPIAYLFAPIIHLYYKRLP